MEKERVIDELKDKCLEWENIGNHYKSNHENLEIKNNEITKENEKLREIVDQLKIFSDFEEKVENLIIENDRLNRNVSQYQEKEKEYQKCLTMKKKLESALKNILGETQNALN